MLKQLFIVSLLLFLVHVVALAQKPTTSISEQVKPAVDHHQHLFSPATLELLGINNLKPLTAEGVIALLDTAGIKRGVVLSVAYMYGRPGR